MFKVIKLTNGKFGIKEINDNGDSLGMKEESFDTEAEAMAFIGDKVESPKENNNNEKSMEDDDEEKEEGDDDEGDEKETDEDDEEEGDDDEEKVATA